MALRNKELILDYIRNNPQVSKADTAKKFKISTATVARFRKLIASEEELQNDTPTTWAERYAISHFERITRTGAYACRSYND